MEELAQVYARSLFEVAKEHGILDELHDQLGIWSDALAEHRSLQVFFFSPRFNPREKKEAIRRIIEGGDERFLNFLELLAERHRLPVTFRIRRTLPSSSSTGRTAPCTSPTGSTASIVTTRVPRRGTEPTAGSIALPGRRPGIR